MAQYYELAVAAAVAFGAGSSAAASALDGMLTALGPSEHRVASGMVTVAACEGPDGETFTTDVISVRPDITFLRQHTAEGTTRILVSGDRVWRWGDDGPGAAAVDPAVRAFVRGHEFHLAVLAARDRFRDITDAGEGRVGERPCRLVAMTDEGGRPASLCLDPGTHLPLELTINPVSEEAGDSIVIHPDNWREESGLTLFRSFELRQGDKVFRYRFELVAPVEIEPGVFGPPEEDPVWLAARLDDLAAVAMMHHRAIEAHRRSDPSLWLPDEVERYLSVNRGELVRRSLAERRTRVAAYLGGTSYHLYRDRRPVVVGLARDGSLAWLACEVEAAGAHRRDDGGQEPVEWIAAWVELLAREGDRWVRVGDASNFRP
jgi:hypothetical protein